MEASPAPKCIDTLRAQRSETGRVDGAVAVITGGAGGMGLATAHLLGRTHHLVISDLDAARLEVAASQLKAHGASCETIVCDVTNVDEVARLMATASRSGHARAVVHTAGISPQMGSVEEILRINTVGVVNVTQAFLPLLGAGACQVNVASGAGHIVPRFMVPRRAYRVADTDIESFLRQIQRRCRVVPRRARPGLAYSLSKNFVTWYSRAHARAFGAYGARILSVSPGTFDTRMGRLEKTSGSFAMALRSALRRVGEPEEIAAVLAFCASTEPGYLTGTDILVDGGPAERLSPRDLLALARSNSPG